MNLFLAKVNGRLGKYALVMLETTEHPTAMEYDALGRPTKITHPNNEAISYQYQETGQVKHIQNQANVEYLKLAQYNGKGQRERVRYGNNVTTNYQYDSLTFRLKEIKSYAQNQENAPNQHLQYEYDAVGNITKKKNLKEPGTFYGGSFTSSDSLYVYDPLYRLVKATGREHDGNVSPTTSDDVFEQNPFLAQVSLNASLAFRTFEETYLYDKVGNITQLAHDGGSTGSFTRNYQYEATSNHLRRTSFSETFSGEENPYDPHGNLTKMVSSLPVMGWDLLDRLSHTAKQAVNTTTGTAETTYYQYDAQGNRVRKITENYAAAGTVFTKKDERLYLGEFEVYNKYTSSSVTFSRTTVHISDEMGRFALIEERTTGTSPEPALLSRYQHSDHLGSSCLETNDLGEVISYEEYHPFGTTAYQVTLSSLPSAAKRYRFCGKERDEECGLYYYGARYYASGLGRFVSVDPQESKYFFQSSYAYAENSPVTKMDFNGEGANQPIEEKKKNFSAAVSDESFSEAGSFNSTASTNENNNAPPRLSTIYVISLDKKINSQDVASKTNEYLRVMKLPAVVKSITLEEFNKISSSLDQNDFVAVIGKSKKSSIEIIRSFNPGAAEDIESGGFLDPSKTGNWETSSHVKNGRPEAIAISTNVINKDIFIKGIQNYYKKVDFISFTVLHVVGHNLDFRDPSNSETTHANGIASIMSSGDHLYYMMYYHHLPLIDIVKREKDVVINSGKSKSFIQLFIEHFK